MALALAAAGCGSAPVAPAAGRQSLSVGFLDDSAGKSSPLEKNGAELAVAEYNMHADSTYHAVLVPVTTNGTPADAAQGAAKLAKTERLVGVVGRLNDADSSSAASVLQQAGMPFLTTSAGSASSAAAGSFRRLVATNLQQGRTLGRYATRLLAPAGPAFVFHDDSPEANDFSQGVKAAFDAAKRPVGRFERIGPKTDLMGLAGSFAPSPPVVLVFAGEGGLGARFAEASRKAGFKGPIVSSSGILSGKPTGAPDGLVTELPVADPAESTAAGFRARYHTKFGAKPPPLALESYEGVSMLLEAAEEVEPKPKDIAGFFALNRSFLGDSKDYEYDETGEIRSSVIWIYQTKAGGWTLVGRWPGSARRKP